MAQLQMSAPVLLDMSTIPERLKTNDTYIAALELKQGLARLEDSTTAAPKQVHGSACERPHSAG